MTSRQASSSSQQGANRPPTIDTNEVILKYARMTTEAGDWIAEKISMDEHNTNDFIHIREVDNHRTEIIFSLVKLLGITLRNLRKTLDKDAFLPGEDYLSVRQDHVRTLYVSFAGVVRLLYRSNKVPARRFTDWATDKLFVLKAGDDHSRAGLASNILGVPVETALSIPQKCPLPCAQFYFLTLGRMEKLRKTMGIKTKNAPNNHIVVKIGATGRGAAVRISEHVGGFGNIKNVEIRFVKAIWTDPHLLSTCEAEVKQYFGSHEDRKVEITGWDTWRDGNKYPTAERSQIFIPPQKLDNVQKLYDAWQAKYGGGYANVLKTNEALQKALRHKEAQETVLADLHNERFRSRDVEIARVRKRNRRTGRPFPGHARIIFSNGKNGIEPTSENPNALREIVPKALNKQGLSGFRDVTFWKLAQLPIYANPWRCSEGKTTEPLAKTKDEIDRAEEIVKIWFDVANRAAELDWPPNSPGRQNAKHQL
ncbi:hypothetical protein HDU86_000515 [Geranomyces michiganensis]|nr:hypothetical protein HDU86_000515 [Geranomyces michiganensis]